MKQATKESVYQSAEQSFGIVPPLIREIAEHSVAAASLYVDGVLTMNGSNLNEQELNAVELRISVLNGCASCVKGHSYLAKKAGLSPEDVEAIVEGRSTSIPALNRILRGTEAVFAASRSGYSLQLAALQEDEFSRQEVFELIGLLSLKTISNGINNYLEAEKAARLVAAG